MLTDNTYLKNFILNVYSRLPLTFYATTIRVREIWIGNLPNNISKNDLKKILITFGEIDRIDVFSRANTFAFVKFFKAESATQCINN